MDLQISSCRPNDFKIPIYKLEKPIYHQLGQELDSTVDHLEEDVLRDLCNLDEMDVLFMKDLGFATLCDQVLYYE